MEENKVEFKFQTEIIRSEEVDGKVYLFGCASSTTIDSYETIFSEKCQEGFVEDCLNSNVIIEIVHGKLETENRFLLAVGKVVDAYLDRTQEQIRTMVKIELNPSHPYFSFIVDSLEGKNTDFGIKDQIGLSIYGFAKESHYELIGRKQIKVFDRVKLTHIAIAEKPSNTDTFVEVIARSIKQEEINRMKQDPKVIVDGINARIVERQKEIMSEVSNFTKDLEEIQKANLSVESMAVAMKAFLEKMYACVSDKMLYLKWDGESLSEYEEEATEEMRTVKENQFKIIDEILSNEIIRKEKENQDHVERTNQSTCSDSNKQCSATCEHTDSRCEKSNSIKSSIDNNNGENKVQEEKKEVVEAEAQAEVQRAEVVVKAETQKEVEIKEVQVSRTEFDSLKSSIEKLTELVQEVSRSSKESKIESSVQSIVEKMDKVEKELEVLRNAPVSTPIQNIPSTATNTKNISREEELFRKVKAGTASRAEQNEWESSFLTRIWNKK